MENKTFYDWLEVSPKASSEVIEKAYKTLVKKYHPDLQQSNKLKNEEIIKKINESYSVLSDKTKRANYDALLQASDYKAQTNIEFQNKQSEIEQEYYRQVENARQQAYHDAYIQDMKNRGYKIRYKKSFKDYVRIIITIVVIMFIIWILWQIPFIRSWITRLSNDNLIVKIIVEIIKSFYEALIKVFV